MDFSLGIIIFNTYEKRRKFIEIYVEFLTSFYCQNNSVFIVPPREAAQFNFVIYQD